MANDVNPFIVPSQQSRPNFKPRERRNLFSEHATHASQGYDVCALDCLCFLRQTGEIASIQARERFLEQYAYESGAADIEVGEVSRV
jgi:hypothetical protein